MRPSGARRPLGSIRCRRKTEPPVAMRQRRARLTSRARVLIAAIAAPIVLLLGTLVARAEKPVPDSAQTIRIATFNTQLGRRGAGLLINDIRKRNAQVLAIAEIILRTRPDILLLTKFDHDPEGVALAHFAELLSDGVAGLSGLDYPRSEERR